MASLQSKTYFLNPIRFMADTARALGQHAAALIASFPQEPGCREAAASIAQAAQILTTVSQAPRERVAAYIYVSTALAAHTHLSWTALENLEKIKQTLNRYLTAGPGSYRRLFPDAATCNATLLRPIEPILSRYTPDAIRALLLCAQATHSCVAEVEREPHQIFFNAPAQLIINIQSFLAPDGRPGLRDAERARLRRIWADMVLVQRQWTSRPDVLEGWWRNNFLNEGFRYWVQLCHYCSWLYCEPSYSLVELYQTLNYYQGWHSGLVRELTEIAFNIDAAGVLDGLRRGR